MKEKKRKFGAWLMTAALVLLGVQTTEAATKPDDEYRGYVSLNVATASKGLGKISLQINWQTDEAMQNDAIWKDSDKWGSGYDHWEAGQYVDGSGRRPIEFFVYAKPAGADCVFDGFYLDDACLHPLSEESSIIVDCIGTNGVIGPQSGNLANCKTKLLSATTYKPVEATMYAVNVPTKDVYLVETGVLEPTKIYAKFVKTASSDVAAVISSDGTTTNGYATLSEAFAEMKSGETVELLCDVDLKSEPWTPVELKGGFDGKGFKISNLIINKPEQNGVGFFSNQTIRKAVKDVEFVNVDVKGLCNVGAIFGYHCFGPVENVKVSGTIKVEALGGDDNGYTRAGVICGGWSYAAYTNVTVNGGDKDASYVKGPRTGVDGRYVAGFVGHLDEDGYFTNCSVKNLTVDGKWETAGFCGDGPGRVCTGCTVENVVLNPKDGYSGALFAWLFAHGNDPALVENATIRNVTFANDFECGTVAEYTEDGGPGAVVKNVTIEGVAPLKYNYQVYVTENGDNFHYANILAAVSDPAIDDLSVITVASDKIEVPAGYELYKKGNLWGVRELSAVVRVGGIEYSSIEVALANSSGDVEMTLIGNATCERITLSDNDDPQVKSLTIDLNGFTLTDNGGDALLTKDRTITIKDSVGTGKFVHTATDDFVWLQGTTGGVVLESGTYLLAESYSYGFAYPANLKTMLVINGGTYNVDPANYKNVNYLSDGYESIDNGNGTWTVQEKVVEVAAVISADGTTTNGYATLQAAFDAAENGETVVLLVDVTSAMNEAFTVAKDKSITFDLNGKVLSGGNNKKTGFAYLTNNGTLTLKDGSVEGTGKITSKTYPDTGDCAGFHTVLNKGTFVMESGTIEEASVNVGGGNNLKWAFRNEASQGQTVVATIKGGTIVANYNAVSDYVYDDTADCTLNIEGGVIKSTGRFSVVTLQDAGSSKPKLHVNVSGGEFIVENKINKNADGNAIFYCDDQTNAGADFTGCFKITGGKFNTFKKELIVDYDTISPSSPAPTHDTGYMTAGLSKCVIPQESIASGYVCAPNTDPETKEAYPWKVQEPTVTTEDDKPIVIDIDPTAHEGAGEAVPVVVTQDLAKEILGEEVAKLTPEQAATVVKKLEEKGDDGMTGWQKYTAGFKQTDKHPLAPKGQSGENGQLVLVTSLVQPKQLSVDTGVKVKYILKKATTVNPATGVPDAAAFEPVQELDTPEFPVDVTELPPETYWKIDVEYTATKTVEVKVEDVTK